ncbi:MAG: Epoxide hydrolase, partial [uncultured Actinomycetospora sp.]
WTPSPVTACTSRSPSTAPPTARPSCCCTASPRRRRAGSRSRAGSPTPGTGCSPPTSAATRRGPARPDAAPTAS